jgi:hypothetical protein
MRTLAKPIALGLATFFGLGVLASAAADSQGAAVSTLARTTTLVGEAKGDAISALAMSLRDLRSDGSKHPANHGAVVSAVARSDATATVNGMTNHGFAVRAVARKH